MPEPRETHAAIDARRNAQRGGGEREMLALALCKADNQALTDYDEMAANLLAAGWAPAASPATVFSFEQALGHAEHTRNAALAERDALAATVARVRDLLAEYEQGAAARDTNPSEWDAADAVIARTLRLVARDLRAALAPSDPATDTGGEDRG